MTAHSNGIGGRKGTGKEDIVSMSKLAVNFNIGILLEADLLHSCSRDLNMIGHLFFLMLGLLKVIV